jgi:hypothetical protein
MASKPGIRITGPGLAGISSALKLLAQNEVLVGFPEDTTDRPDDAGMTNAALGYIHDNGAPEANIPPRPFMLPGIAKAQTTIAAKLGETMRAALNNGNAQTIEKGLTQAGLIGKLAIQNEINSGLSPALADSTLRSRGRGRTKSAQEELARRKAGEAPSSALAKPLIVTGELRNAINYVIRARRRRR